MADLFDRLREFHTPPQGWREVDKDTFYAAIGQQNVHPTPMGKYPYASHFKTQLGELRGIASDGCDYTIYYLPPEAI